MKRFMGLAVLLLMLIGSYVYLRQDVRKPLEDSTLPPSESVLGLRVHVSTPTPIKRIQSEGIDENIFWIAPVWHQLELPENIWTTMAARLGGNDQPYVKIAMTANIGYVNDTYGGPNFIFRSNFYDEHRTEGHKNDNLSTYYNMAENLKLKVVAGLSGGPWSDWIDCSVVANPDDYCTDIGNNVATWLESLGPDYNQWNQGNVVPEESTEGGQPPLQKILSYNIYANDPSLYDPANPDKYEGKIGYYMKNNIQQATREIWDDPTRRSLTVGFSIDADLFQDSWGDITKFYDYNPWSIKQFRDWLTCGSGIGSTYYGSAGEYSNYANQPCLTDITQVNSAFGTTFTSIEAIDPPRDRDPNSRWWQKWTEFRQHQVMLINLLKKQWVEEVGVPAGMISAHLGTDNRIATYTSEYSAESDLSGASIEAGGLPPYEAGFNQYGAIAQNRDNQFFQRIKKVNPNWTVTEVSPVDLGATGTTDYGSAYRSVQQYYLHGARIISPMTWHVYYDANGVSRNGEVKVRDTAYEDAIRDFVQLYGKYPRGDMAWEFGKVSDKCADKTGVTKVNGFTCNPTDKIDNTSMEDWTKNSDLTYESISNGEINLIVMGADPSFVSPDNLAFTAQPTDLIKVRIKFQPPNPTSTVSGQIYWLTESDLTWNENKYEYFPITSDGNWYEYEIQVGKNPNWKGLIKQFRVDTGTESNLVDSKVSFDYVWVTKTPILGDANGDGKVDGVDYSIWVANYDTTTTRGPAAGDFNNDGIVDGVDYSVWVANYSP